MTSVCYFSCSKQWNTDRSAVNPGFFRRGGGTKGGARPKFYYVDYYVDWEIRSQQLLKFSSAINKVDLSITRKSNDCYFSIISNFLC